MKNLLKTIILFIGVSILFTSCRGSLTKRHYRNGYHFSMAGKNQVPKENAKQTNDKADHSSASAQTVTPVTEEIVYASASNKAISPNSISSDYSMKPKMNHYSSKEEQSPIALPGFTEKNSFDAVTETKGENKKSLRTNDETYSLLWTVCLIIFIFWLIAFLLGGWIFGELVHLFLVVALILLILWLLRII